MHNTIIIVAVIEIKTIVNTLSTQNTYLSVIFLPGKNWCSEHNTLSAVTIPTSVARHVLAYYAEKHVRKTTPCIPTLSCSHNVIEVRSIILITKLKLKCTSHPFHIRLVNIIVFRYKKKEHNIIFLFPFN